jgi:hypothetical protein
VFLVRTIDSAEDSDPADPTNNSGWAVEMIMSTIHPTSGEHLLERVQSQKTIPEDSWAHIGCVYDSAAGSARIYLQGEVCGETVLVGKPIGLPASRGSGSSADPGAAASLAVAAAMAATTRTSSEVRRRSVAMAVESARAGLCTMYYGGLGGELSWLLNSCTLADLQVQSEVVHAGVSDWHWYPHSIDEIDTRRLFDGSLLLYRMRRYAEAEDYAYRLCSLALYSAMSTKAGLGLLSSSRWISLFLKLLALPLSAPGLTIQGLTYTLYPSRSSRDSTARANMWLRQRNKGGAGGSKGAAEGSTASSMAFGFSSFTLFPSDSASGATASASQGGGKDSAASSGINTSNTFEKPNPRVHLCVLRLFRRLLAPLRPDALSAPTVKVGQAGAFWLHHYPSRRKTSARVVAGSGLNAASAARGPHGVIEFLCSLLADAWWGRQHAALGDATADRTSARGTHGQSIGNGPPHGLQTLLQGILGGAGIGIGGITGAASGGGGASTGSEATQLRVQLSPSAGLLSSVTELVMLLRRLLVSPLWSGHLAGCFSRAIADAPALLQQWEDTTHKQSKKLQGKEQKDEQKKGQKMEKGSKQSSSEDATNEGGAQPDIMGLSVAIAALGVLGGHVETVRVGARVQLLAKKSGGKCTPHQLSVGSCFISFFS